MCERVQSRALGAGGPGRGWAGGIGVSRRVFPSMVPCPVRPRGEPHADGGSCSSRGCLPIFLPAGQELVQQGLTFIFLFF